PDLGIAGRQLPTIGVRGLHGAIALAIDDGNCIPLFGQGIGRRDAGDAGANNGDVVHESSKKGGRRRLTATPHLFLVPESFTMPAYGWLPFGGRESAALQIVLVYAVLLPESFRGGCSVGAGAACRTLLHNLYFDGISVAGLGKQLNR